jgi:FlaA1/EpsC-like NDP-sugar epimerase
MNLDKRLLNFLVIVLLTFLTFSWTFFIFRMPFDFKIIGLVIAVRFLFSFSILKDYSLSWSKATQKTFLIKSLVYISAFIVYMPFVYGHYRIAFMLSELFLYLFAINFLMYAYYYVMNKSKIVKTKRVIIYGAGKAGLKLEEEFKNSEYKVKYFVDDSAFLHKRTIDGIQILSQKQLRRTIKNEEYDLLVIAIPSAPKERVKTIYNRFDKYFKEIKILPSLEEILLDEQFSKQLQNISVEDLLARHPQDLDKKQISSFIENKKILITGAGGSIGSEIVRQCVKFNAKELVLLDHSEYNLYKVEQEVMNNNIKINSIMHSVVNIKSLEKTFDLYRPDVVIHAAAYKHVPLVESNVKDAIINNVIGTKNCIDMAIKYDVKKFVLISTDKAVRPTNVMGTTKRICELYAQNVNAKNTEIVAVRFGNVLGSSGSVIPKFKEQIKNGGPITVTHPDITRYFMLIPEACELVLQAASIGRGGELFILDMGKPIKIVDLAKKMIELSNSEVEITFTGLRPGEKLYEELLIHDTDEKTKYESITVAKPTVYSIGQLNEDIEHLVNTEDVLEQLKKIVPEFKHSKN